MIPPGHHYPNVEGIHRKPAAECTFWHYLAIGAMALVLLSFASPQIRFMGHGLKTTLPALCLAFVSIFAVNPEAITCAFSRFWGVLVCGALFFIQAAFRFAQEEFNAGSLWHTYFNSPLISILFLVWIAAFTELGPKWIVKLRSWILFSWCGSLALGLPMLISDPGVARTTMGGNIRVAQNIATLAPCGVGEYTVYTSLAICSVPLAALVIIHLKRVCRWVAATCLAAGLLSVFISTFTMAMVLMVAGLSFMLLVWQKHLIGIRKAVPMILFVAAAIFLPGLYAIAKTLPQTTSAVSKAERLILGVSEKGLTRGD
ncbi:MAG: hypothetical protein HKP58_06950, partial [Desulfatitalea sp.]|nr:hypothetical protein [Desulfatitalea sp.]NNK00134.1 hypothetical protein [Desulfatitalea sp.]